MQLEVGSVLEGKVTGITKFGAFVTLPDGKSGLVHISEIANTYVSDVREHVSEGAVVKVRVLGFGDNGRINLSIKKAAEQPQRAPSTQRTPSTQQRTSSAQRAPSAPQQPKADTFEDKLKQFIQDSDSKISGLKKQTDRRNNSRKRRS